MSEVPSRPSRGRSSARGRGGAASRSGPRSGRQKNGEHNPTLTVDDSVEEGEIGQLKKSYRSQLTTLKELFPDWTDLDLVLALQGTDGDLQSTIEQITEGNVSQFSEIKKKTKDRSRSKVTEVTSGSETPHVASRPSRGRGGKDTSRGGRGRGRSDRGRGTSYRGRGASHGTPNGSRNTGYQSFSPTIEPSSWEVTPVVENDFQESNWETVNTEEISEGQWGSYGEQDHTSPETKTTVVPEPPVKKTWASMFATPKPAPTPRKPVIPTSAVAEPASSSPNSPSVDEATEFNSAEKNTPLATDDVQDSLWTLQKDAVGPIPSSSEDYASNLEASMDELTVHNLEKIPDESHLVVTETAASTAASSRDTPNLTGPFTCTPSSQHPSTARSQLCGGVVTPAYRAAGRSGSFNRKILGQQEPVVMPGNHAVDRAAVQFGSIGIGADSEALNVDDDREELETRTQPPQHSPPSQPRASLPPVPRQKLPSDTVAMETHSAPKQAPGLHSIPQQQSTILPQNPIGAQIMSQQGSQGSQAFNLFSRYGQPVLPSESSVTSQKPQDQFSSQISQQTQLEGYASQQQCQSQPQTQPQSDIGGISSSQAEYTSHYSSDQHCNAYPNLYGTTYGQHSSGIQQDSSASLQRPGSDFGATNSAGDSTLPANQPPPTASRYVEAQNSGNTTPNHAMNTQVHSVGQSQQNQQIPQQPHGQTGHSAGFQYQHPYYSSPYYSAYVNQFTGYGQQGYSGPFANKGGMYGQQHLAYGMSTQSPYDQHSSSPANVTGYAQSSMHNRDTGLGAVLGEYGRSGTNQLSQGHNAGTGGFNGIPDVFGRSQSGIPVQTQPYSQQQNSQQPAIDDSLKPFGESKAGTGPTPSILNQPGRPGSAVNNGSGHSAQTGLAPPQSHQQSFTAGYPSHLSPLQGVQGSQCGALGGLGGHHAVAQNHQASAYGGYGAGFSNYGNYGRGGWGGNYGH